MTFVIPGADTRELILPPLPDTTSPPLRAAAERYLTGFFGDVSDESGECWTGAAQELAACQPASLADVATKLLLITHYMMPLQHDGQAMVDLDAFEADTGRMLLRCVADIGAFAEREH